MKVSELIDELKKYDQDAPVFLKTGAIERHAYCEVIGECTHVDFHNDALTILGGEFEH